MRVARLVALVVAAAAAFQPIAAHPTPPPGGGQCGGGACTTSTIARPVLVSLTTTADRIQYLEPVLHRLLYEQTLPPSKVLLVLAKKPLRAWRAEDWVEPGWIGDMDRLVLRWVDEDIGPGLKLYGALSALRPDQDAALVIVDDDFIYPRNLVESLVHALARAPSPRVAVGLRGYVVGGVDGPWCTLEYVNALATSPESGQLASDYEEVDVIGAFLGYAVWRTALPDIASVEAFLNDIPRAALLADDDSVAGLMGDWGVRRFVAPQWAVPGLSAHDFIGLKLPNSLNTFSPCSYQQSLLQDITLRAMVERGSLGIRLGPHDGQMRRCGGRCGDQSVCFLGECWCKAGWDGPGCSKRYVHPVRKDGGRGCDGDASSMTGCNDGVAGGLCRLTCGATATGGVVQLPHATAGHGPVPIETAGLSALKDGMDSLATGMELGRVLEINPGSGTPVLTGLMTTWRPDLTISTFTLAGPVDPPGLASALPIGTTLRRWSAPLSDAMELCDGREYDTIVSVGALQGVADALAYLSALWRCTRRGGLLVLRDVCYDDIAVGPWSDGDLALRVMRGPLDHLLSKFEVIHVSEVPRGDWGREVAAIAVKK